MKPFVALPWNRDYSALPIAQRIASQTARRIVEKQLEAGDLLTEVDLAAHEGVSRTPVREAMVQLDNWGLIKLMPKKGGLVTAITNKDTHDLVSVRAMLETDALAQLLSHSPERLAEHAATLHGLLDQQHTSATHNDYLAFAAADFEFHAHIIRSSGNALIENILVNLAPRMARLTYHVVLGAPQSITKFLTEHENMADLFVAGNLSEFQTLARHHVHSANFPA